MKVKENNLEAWLVTKISSLTGVQEKEISVEQPFARFGLDSVAAVSLSGELEDRLGTKLSPRVLYDYPSVKALADHLSTLD